jgi:hypothetical protein
MITELKSGGARFSINNHESQIGNSHMTSAAPES